MPAEPSPPIPGFDAGRLGRGVAAGIGAVGAAASLAWACLRALGRPRIYLPLTFAQIREIGLGSLPLVLDSLHEALLTAATHADEAATGASALVQDVRARPERYVRMSLF